MIHIYLHLLLKIYLSSSYYLINKQIRHFPVAIFFLELPQPTAWQVRTYDFVQSRYFYHHHGGLRPLPIYLLPAEIFEWLESPRYRQLGRSLHNCQLDDMLHPGAEDSTSIWINANSIVDIPVVSHFYRTITSSLPNSLLAEFVGKSPDRRSSSYI